MVSPSSFIKKTTADLILLPWRFLLLDTLTVEVNLDGTLMCVSEWKQSPMRMNGKTPLTIPTCVREMIRLNHICLAKAAYRTGEGLKKYQKSDKTTNSWV